MSNSIIYKLNVFLKPIFQLSVEVDDDGIVTLPEGEYEDVKQIWVSIDSDESVHISSILVVGCLSEGSSMSHIYSLSANFYSALSNTHFLHCD